MTARGAHLLGGLVDLLYPALCASCRVRLNQDEKVICHDCWTRLMPTGLDNCKALLSHKRRLNWVMAGWFYEEVLQGLVHDLKYKEKRGIAEELAGRLSDMFDGVCRRLNLDAVIPVPLHSVRLRERGFNQSDLLARPLAKALDLPYAPGILKRRRNTSSQTALSVQARLRNVEGAFTVNNLGNLKRVLLIDDVVTTGATLSSCAEAIRSAGGKYVAALVVGTPFVDPVTPGS